MDDTTGDAGTAQRLDKNHVGDYLAAVWPNRDGTPFLKQCERLPTQSVIAEKFTGRFTIPNCGRAFRYTAEVGWFVWADGRGWYRDRDGETIDMIRRVVDHLTDGMDKTDQKRAQTSGFVSGVERLARTDPEHVVPVDAWDSDPNLAGLPTGRIIHLPTGRVFYPDPRKRITRRLGTLPDDRPPDRWLRFLNQASGFDAELVKFLQRWVGYCLTGHTREHALMFVYGPGGTGKTTFLNTVRKLLGDYVRHASMDTFLAARGERHPTDLAMLSGSRLVTAVETDERRPWDEPKLKALTGGDPITARFMRRNFFTYRPNYKLLIAGNHMPTLRSPDEAMRRRFRVVPFTRPPAKPDPNLESKLADELPQILGWAIDGAAEWYEHGLGTAAIVEQATADYFTESDLIGQWIAETCETKPGAEQPTDRASTLWGSWRSWAATNRIDPGNRTRFGRELTRRGHPSTKRGGVVYRQGIRLHRTNPPPTADHDQGHYPA